MDTIIYHMIEIKTCYGSENFKLNYHTLLLSVFISCLTYAS